MKKLISCICLLAGVATVLADPFPLETRLANAQENEVIEVPAGTYTLSRGYYLPNGVKLIAEPGAEVIIRGWGLSTEGRSNCLVAGITFEDIPTMFVDHWGGTALYVSSSCVVSNCVFRRIPNAIQAQGTITDCVFSNCTGYCAITAGDDFKLIRTKISDIRITAWIQTGYTCSAPVIVSSVGKHNALVSDCIIENVDNPMKEEASAGFSFVYNDLTLAVENTIFSNLVARMPVVRAGRDAPTQNRVYFTNCLFTACNSRTATASGGKWDGASGPFYMVGEIVNCTLHNNRNADTGNIYTDPIASGSGHVVIRNSILADYKSDQNYTYNSITANASKNGNITTAPTFVGSGKAPFMLARGSAGIDAGDDAVWAGQSSAKDIRGKTRVRGKHVDMGCYESVPPGFSVQFY